MSTYSIKDLEQLSGIKAHTLRIWEQRYNIITPSRTDTNIRTYDDRNLKLVLNIALLKDHGFKISEIAKLSFDEINQEVLRISEQQLSYPDQIQSLTLSMIDLDEDRFEKTINANIAQFGLENAMIHVVYPFLSRVGILWLTGSIGPWQEHFITNLIRQKLIAAIDRQPWQPGPHTKKFLLFLPEGEYHEIGLLLTHYLLRTRGHKVIYLGQNLPAKDLTYIYRRHKADYIFTALTSSLAHHEVQDFVNELASEFPEATLLLTGFQVIGQDIDVPANAIIINQVNDLLRLVA